jgi:DUF2892 family protein
MNIDRIVLTFAGRVILLSLILSHYHSLHWVWLTVFVGANLLQAGFTGFCPLAKMLKAIGEKLVKLLIKPTEFTRDPYGKNTTHCSCFISKPSYC